METSSGKQLFHAILSLQSIQDCEDFFGDLCTPAELRAFQDRWAVVLLLAEGQLSYRQIHERTGVSVTTIGRVARYFTTGTGGYAKVLQRMNKKDEDA